jgi:2-oxoglutarate dehydrogenase E2 component (dihydrolipoamide succinyltransferase)
MGDSITEGTIVDIPVAPGDYVNEDDVVLVLETDKVSVDVRAPEAGAVVEIMGEVDDVVEVGSGLYRLDTDAVAPAGGGQKKVEAAAPAAAAAPVAETKDEPAPAPTPVVAAAPPAPEKKAAPPTPPSMPVMESITTSLGNRPERRSKMSRMR